MSEDVERVARETCPEGPGHKHDPSRNISCDWSLRHTREVISHLTPAPDDGEFDRWLAEHDREVAESIAAWVDSGPRRQFAAWASREVVKEEFLNHAEIAEAIRGGEYAAPAND